MKIKQTPSLKTKKKISETNAATKRILKYFLRIGTKAWRHNVLPIPDSEGNLRPGSKSGVPDIIGIYGGRGFNYRSASSPGAGIFIGVEVKKGRDRLRPTQEGFHFESRKLGAIIIVAEGRDADEIFNSFLSQWTQITTQI